MRFKSFFRFPTITWIRESFVQRPFFFLSLTRQISGPSSVGDFLQFSTDQTQNTLQVIQKSSPNFREVRQTQLEPSWQLHAIL